jgi:hypothetical protein
MPAVEQGPTIKSLAEVAWLLSRVGQHSIQNHCEPSPLALKQFWQSARTLQQVWDEFLNSEACLEPDSQARFEEVAAQLFTTELVTRVWSTILAGIDLQTGKQDLTRIATNTVNGFLQVRHRLLSQLLKLDCSAAWAGDLERLRRRCDRWTDLLIGNICGADEIFQFAFDVDRAKDFAEEAAESDETARPVEFLVAAGVRLSLLGQLPNVTLDSPAFEGLVQSIMGSVPEQAFLEDGTLSSRRKSSKGESASTSLIPGLDLSRFRGRHS